MNKILIIRFSSIGDVILTSPVIRAVKNQTKAEIHFISTAVFGRLMNFNPHIDKIWRYESGDKEIINSLKEEQYDLVIDLQKNLKSKKIIRKLGVKSINFDKTNINKWLHVNFKYPALSNDHIVDRYFDSLKSIGVKNDGLGLEFFVDPQYSRKVPRKKYICISLGAAHFTKQIPEEIITQICDRLDIKILLLGGRGDKAKGQSIAKGRKHVENFAGTLSMHESANKIKHSKLILAADTGLMHMAVALDVPTIVMWGSTVPEFGMYPYYGEKKTFTHNHEVEGLSCRPCSKLGKTACPKKHFNCMMKQNIDLIVEQIEYLVED